jgi:undecaprenyl pyrophosphate phosphatase UppP
MNQIDWFSFINLLPFMMVGLAVHVLKQLKVAKERSDYSWVRFKQLNGLGYIIAFMTGMVLLIILTAGIDKMPFANQVIDSFTIGVSGGSMLRKVGAKE